MTDEPFIVADPRLRAVVEEMQTLIGGRFPGTTFRLAAGEDPGSFWLWATVDLHDPDEVTDLTIDREMELLVEEGLSLRVIPVPTRERSDALLQQQRAARERALVGTT